MKFEIEVDVVERFEALRAKGEQPRSGESLLDYMPIGQGKHALPATFWLTCKQSGGGPSWRMEFVVRDGAPECRQITLKSAENGREIRSNDVGALKIEDAIEYAARYLVRRVEVGDDGQERYVLTTLEERDGGPNLAAVRAARREHKRKVTPELLREVAEVYRANLGKNPTQAVADHFDRAHRTAALWVQRAREAGHLGKTTRGKAGEQ